MSLLLGVCAACMLAYRYLQMKWCAVVKTVAILSQKLAECTVPIRLLRQILVLAPCCSRATLVVLACQFKLPRSIHIDGVMMAAVCSTN